jgi:hypothetical protein
MLDDLGPHVLLRGYTSSPSQAALTPRISVQLAEQSGKLLGVVGL